MSKIIFVIIALLLNCLFINAQLIDDFNDNILTNWAKQAPYSLAETNQELSVTATNAFNFQVFNKYGLNENFASSKVLYLKIKTSIAVTVRVDLGDNAGKTTNANALSILPTTDGAYHVYSFDFNNRFRQSFPSSSLVDSTAITQVIIFFNPTGPSFNGNVFLDSLGHAAATILPVHFTSFAGVATNDNVKLNFSVEEETDADKYIIQKSANGMLWENIGKIVAVNSGRTAEYLFTDASPYTGSNFYRVEIIKQSGATIFSSIWKCSFKNNSDKSKLITIAPGQYQLFFNTASTDPPVSVEVYNFMGQLLYRKLNFPLQQTMPLSQNKESILLVKRRSGAKEVFKLSRGL